MDTETRESWSGKLGFVLAAAGSAIGLGNIWKFPYITGMNGGGAFVLVYLGCILLFGLPLMLCEIAIGRKTGRNPYGAFKALQVKRSRMADAIACCCSGRCRWRGRDITASRRFSSAPRCFSCGSVSRRSGCCRSSRR